MNIFLGTLPANLDFVLILWLHNMLIVVIIKMHPVIWWTVYLLIWAFLLLLWMIYPSQEGSKAGPYGCETECNILVGFGTEIPLQLCPCAIIIPKAPSEILQAYVKAMGSCVYATTFLDSNCVFEWTPQCPVAAIRLKMTIAVYSMQLQIPVMALKVVDWLTKCYPLSLGRGRCFSYCDEFRLINICIDYALPQFNNPVK